MRVSLKAGLDVSAVWSGDMGDSFRKRWSTEEVLRAVEGDVADEERSEFIVEHRSGLYSFSTLCEKYQISRKTGYKIVDRFEHP
jgi:hypothetical protein